MAFLVASPVVQRYLLAGEEEAERAVVISISVESQLRTIKSMLGTAQLASTNQPAVCLRQPS